MWRCGGDLTATRYASPLNVEVAIARQPAFSATHAQQTQRRVRPEGLYACQHKETLQRMLNYSRADDLEAADKLLNLSARSGECIDLAGGTTVFVVSMDLFSFVQVRPKGQVETYWTAIAGLSE